MGWYPREDGCGCGDGAYSPDRPLVSVRCQEHIRESPWEGHELMILGRDGVARRPPNGAGRPRRRMAVPTGKRYGRGR